MTGAPIRAFVGPNGGGKTLAAVTLVVEPALRAGRRVVATCPIKHPRASLLESWRDLPDLHDCVLLLDEVTSQLPSRQSMSAPSQLVRMVNQLRKVDVDLAWTAPNWSRADVALREVTQSVTVCRGQLPDRWLRVPERPPWWRLSGERLREGDKPLRGSARWPSNRLFRWLTYNAVGFDEFTYRAVKDVKPLAREWYWRPWHVDQYLYETLAAVELLDHLDDVGVCLACGGSRSRPKCRCGTSSARTAGEGRGEDRTDEIPIVAPNVGRTVFGPIGAGSSSRPRPSL
jgi:hypothetical protein